MSGRDKIANWPLAWKVPLLAVGLLVGVAVVISQSVLNRLESDQENNLRLLTSAYLDGLSAAVLPSAIHADVWEAFDALDRASEHYAGVSVRFAVVALPNGKVLAASDPLKFPVHSAIPPEVERRFPTQDGLAIDNEFGPSMARSLSSRRGLFGRTHSRRDRYFRVASCAQACVADVDRGERRSRARFCHSWRTGSEAHAEASKRTQRLRRTCSSRARGSHSRINATSSFS